MKELSFERMERIKGGNRCSNYDNGLATFGMIVGAVGLTMATGGAGLLVAGLGFASSFASVMSCNGVYL
ncbi:hypothetical protein [Echinicola vietnamensis]|uniref:Class IIb bacteriocin, lactobin A/cerein 7B family n=1 Tax=Echinicola vietnamensis (strain DSM 17526 / LMG 23754 / KMM 6221) TaxID=926556 RepID=L0G0F2_ECHVK|nr:hypothetical protein [Echinicola vietnamensis]AGA78486.1 hypothetical protein Echvi_2236 [Echinicola vietnamensis DSM 17526]